jgi:TonB family protein
MKTDQEPFLSTEQSYKKTFRKKLTIILLVSLFIHIVLLFFFFNFGFRKQTVSLFKSIFAQLTEKQIAEKKRLETKPVSWVIFKDLPKPIKQSKIQVSNQTKNTPLPLTQKPITPPPSGIAKLKARKSNFGWDVPQDTPQPALCSIPTTLTGQAAKTEEPVVVNKSKKIESDKIPDGSTLADSHLEDDVKIYNHNLSKDAEKPIGIPKIVINQQNKAEQTQEDKIERIKEIEEKQAMFEQITSGQLSQISTEKISSSKTTGRQGQLQPNTQARGAYDASGRKRPNIIALTKGFVENIHDNGNDLIDRDGDENIQASFEEMKYISYEAKINWCLQAAWKQNFESRCLTTRATGKAYVDFTIDQQGNLLTCELLQSTGSPELDKVIMKNMQFAAPYPPLPNHFGVKKYRTGRRIEVYARKFSM